MPQTPLSANTDRNQPPATKPATPHERTIASQNRTVSVPVLWSSAKSASIWTIRFSNAEPISQASFDNVTKSSQTRSLVYITCSRAESEASLKA